MPTCPDINIPQVDNTPTECAGNIISTNCVAYPNAISYLNLPANSSQSDINNALLISLMNARTRISTLESIVEGFETRISALETP